MIKSNKSDVKIYTSKPADFISDVEAVGCYIEIEHEVLFLQRADSERGFWGIPAGKIENGETPDDAAKRELFEETGISTASPSKLSFIEKLYVRRPGCDFVFFQYRLALLEKPTVILSNEHLDYQWISREDVEGIPLMVAAQETFVHYLKKVGYVPSW